MLLRIGSHRCRKKRGDNVNGCVPKTTALFVLTQRPLILKPDLIPMNVFLTQNVFSGIVHPPHSPVTFDSTNSFCDATLVIHGRAYFYSSTTLNYLRGLLNSGFASLHHPRDWSFTHVRSPSLRCVRERENNIRRLKSKVLIPSSSYFQKTRIREHR